jgi:GNAT superfamily N-acetyltransferase
MTYIHLTCTQATFRPCPIAQIRWLNQPQDYFLASEFWPATIPLRQSDWDEAHAQSYRYCAFIENEHILSLAAEWRYSEHQWEVAGVQTRPLYRRRGYAKAVVSFVTTHILAQGRVATCTIEASNIGMICTAQSVGFERVKPPP